MYLFSSANFILLKQDAIKYENGRDLKGQTIVVEWARGPSSRPPMRSRVCIY